MSLSISNLLTDSFIPDNYSNNTIIEPNNFFSNMLEDQFKKIDTPTEQPKQKDSQYSQSNQNNLDSNYDNNNDNSTADLNTNQPDNHLNQSQETKNTNTSIQSTDSKETKNKKIEQTNSNQKSDKKTDNKQTEQTDKVADSDSEDKKPTIKTDKKTDAKSAKTKTSEKTKKTAIVKKIKKDPKEIALANLISQLQQILETIKQLGKNPEVTKKVEKLQQVLVKLTNFSKNEIKISNTDLSKLENLIKNFQEILADPKKLANFEKQLEAAIKEQKTDIKEYPQQTADQSAPKNIKETHAYASTNTKSTPTEINPNKGEITTVIKKLDNDLQALNTKLEKLVSELNAEVTKIDHKYTHKASYIVKQSNTTFINLTKAEYPNKAVETQTAEIAKKGSDKKNKKNIIKPVDIKDNKNAKISIIQKSNKGFINFKNTDNQVVLNKINNTNNNNTEANKVDFDKQIDINKAEKQFKVVNQFRSFLSLNKLKAETELTMKLHPKSLGEIKIKLIKETNSTTNETNLVAAKFQVSNHAVKAILESNFDALRDSLEENTNLLVSAFDVDVNEQENGDNQSFNQFFDNNFQGSKEKFALSNDEQEVSTISQAEDIHDGAMSSLA